MKVAAAASALVFAAGFAASGTAKVSGNPKRGHKPTTTTTSTSAGTPTPSTTTQTTTAPTSTTTSPPPPAPAPAPAPSGTILFRGDYETGSFSQWDGHQWSRNNDQGFGCSATGDSGASVVTSPAPAQGRYAANFMVYAGRSGCVSNPRAEVSATQAETGGYPGQEWYYGWWLMATASDANRFYCTTSDWNLFTQFHQPGTGGPQLSFGFDPTGNCADPSLYFKLDTSTFFKTRITGPIAFGHWYHIVLHVRWATDASGLFQVYVDGNEVVPLHTSQQTLFNSGQTSTGTVGAYWKQGFYGSDETNGQGIGDYLDGACRADSYAAAAAC